MLALDPDAFATAEAGSKFLLTMLVARPGYLRVLCDPNDLTVAQSATLLRRAKALDHRVEWKLVRLLAEENHDSGCSSPFVSHCLEVLAQLSGNASTLPALRD
jgi:hypothetical protein